MKKLVFNLRKMLILIKGHLFDVTNAKEKDCMLIVRTIKVKSPRLKYEIANWDIKEVH